MTRAIALDHVQLAMPAGGEAAARRFYGDLLGIPEVAKPADRAARGGCWFEDGALKVHLGVEAGFAPARKAHPAFVVSDLPAMIARLEQSGHAVTREGPQAFTHDPFGNRIELVG